MQNLAYKIDVDLAESRLSFKTLQENTEFCAACGEPLFGAAAAASSWQAWGTFWEIVGQSNVELVCGACGEYLQAFFKERD